MRQTVLPSILQFKPTIQIRNRMQNPSKSTKTRFCLVSDTHNQDPKSSDATGYTYRQPLPSADVLLHAGDLTMVGGFKEYQKVLNWIKAADAELKIVIAGNHDLDLHEDYYVKHSGETEIVSRGEVKENKELWTGAEAKEAGIFYLEEGLKTFTLKSGATFTIYTSPWQPEFYDWAFNYPRDEDRFNPPATSSDPEPCNPIPSWPMVDIILTHGPPYGILDKTARGDDAGCEFLRNAVRRARPRLHCFGHIHEGWGAQRIKWNQNVVENANPAKEQMLRDRSAYLSAHNDTFGEETVFVNASIMNLQYRPLNAPWVVDLSLPVQMQS